MMGLSSASLLLVSFLMTTRGIVMGDFEALNSQGGVDDQQPYGDGHIKYTTVKGFFLQDDPDTNPDTFNYTKENLGLIKQEYPTDDKCKGKKLWERFECYVDHLNAKAADNVQYKVIVMGRHGEGYHNVAEDKYGTEKWDCYWSRLDGDGNLTWSDAHLTPTGKDQARAANAFWADLLANKGAPAPQRYYVSPLWRCLQTAHLSWHGLDVPKSRPFTPLIKEKLRETIGIHTCDRRSTRSEIHEGWPKFPIEEGFTQKDELWSPELRETSTLQTRRATELLDDVFEHDDSTWISFTSHSGHIAAILRALRHQEFGLSTGAQIPVLVKAEWKKKPAPYTSLQPSTTDATCTVTNTATATSS